MQHVKNNNTLRFFIIGVLFLLITILKSGTVLGDDTAMGRTPEGVYSINDNDIVMVSEDIYVDVKRGKAKCIFEFKNTGKEKNVLMGFPAEMKNYEQPIMDLSVREFKVFIDESEIPIQLEKNVKPNGVKEEKLSLYDSWYTFDVPFEENETKIVENTYTFKSSVCSIGPGLIRTGYILETGSNWKGSIGYARVYFDMGDIRFTNIETLIPEEMECFKFHGDNLVFEKKDFEPNFNLEISYYLYQKDIKFNDDEYGRQLRKGQEEQESRYEDIKRFINNAKPEEILEKAKKSYEEGKDIESKYLYSYVSKEYRQENKPQTEENSQNKELKVYEKEGVKSNKASIEYVILIFTIVIAVAAIVILKVKKK